MSELKIYGTVFNNAEYIDACLNSLKPLGKLDLYVVDNYSITVALVILVSLAI